MKPEKINIAIAELRGVNLFVIRKPIHAPSSYYRENACGYTMSLNEAWKVPEDVAKKYICGRPTDPDRVIMEPAPPPDYLNDANECVKLLEELLTSSPQRRLDIYFQNQWSIFLDERSGEVKHATGTFCHAVCELYLKAHGKRELNT